jgi:hypothetical protein
VQGRSLWISLDRKNSAALFGIDEAARSGELELFDPARLSALDTTSSGSSIALHIDCARAIFLT